MHDEIRLDDINEWLERGAQLVDVRETWEYQRGHIPGAISIPMGEIVARQDEIDDPVILVCATGNRSGRAAEFLVKNGRSQVANLLGGTVAWVEHGHAVETGPESDGEPESEVG